MTTGILALVVMAFTFSFPESPRWLALKNRIDEARQVLSVVDDMPPDSQHVELVLQQICAVNENLAETASFWSLFKQGPEKTRYRLLLAASSQMFSQMSGSALITYYSEQLFSTVGLSHDLSKILGATDLTFKLICCAIPFFTIEIAGRRKLFMIAASGMTVCMVSRVYYNVLTSSSAWLSAAHKSPKPTSSQPISPSCSPLCSSHSTLSGSSASTFCTVKKSFLRDTEHPHQAYPQLYIGSPLSLLLVSTPESLAEVSDDSSWFHSSRMAFLSRMGMRGILHHPHGILFLPRDYRLVHRRD